MSDSACPDRKRRTSRIYTVRGVTANLAAHCRSYSVCVQLAHKRVIGREWTIEQALGIDPPPPRRYNKRSQDARPTKPLLSPEEIITRVVLGQLTGEQYLRLEGVPDTGYTLDHRTAFEVTDEH